MTVINTLIPFTSAIISFIFAFMIFKRYFNRRGTHLLLWGIGMLFFGIAGFCGGYFGAFGWNPFIFRMWYLFGAILVAAWLGQGTVYLLAKRRVANILMVILGVASLYAAIRVFGAQLDPSLLTTSVQTGTEFSGHAIITPGIRTLTPFFNIYGTVTLWGGALYSAWIFYRKRILLHRVIGNILIAVGALAAASGGLFSRYGIPSGLYIGNLLGVTLIFLGFLRATTPMEEKDPQTASEVTG